MTNRIGILHPGEMGAAVAFAARSGGAEVCWASEGRSAATARRAAKAGLIDLGTVAAICRECDIMVSVCPPHAAEMVAAEVAEHGFKGLYLEGNAITPERTKRIAHLLAAVGADTVDGGIIGGPAWEPGGTTCLYLSGPRAQELADCFQGGPLAIRVVDDTVGTASALKLCYAAYSKGTTALLATILAASDELGVREELYRHWDSDDAGFSERTNRRARRVTAKAWRFAGEMEEIASMFESVGLPGDFHRAAAEVYRRLAGFKGAPETPELPDVLAALVVAEPSSSAPNLTRDLPVGGSEA